MTFTNVSRLTGSGILSGNGIHIVNGNPGEGNHEGYKEYAFIFNPVKVRFLRFYVFKGDVDNDTYIEEIEIYPSCNQCIGSQDTDNDGIGDACDSCIDGDGDGYGIGAELHGCSGSQTKVDCDDNDPDRFPGNPEICDDKDNDCDEQIDEGATATYYPDVDGDGYGDASGAIAACLAPAGYVTDNTDCDDADPNVNPGMTEVFGNGIDDDCQITLPPPNSPPVADAGPDQHVYMWDIATLDGSGSTDIDGDLLTYSWTIFDSPPDSMSTLFYPNDIMPTLEIDSHGDYEIQLIVNDGMDDSEPDTVLLNVDNVKPVADAGPDQAVFIGDFIELDGSASSDVDGDLLTYNWDIVTAPIGSTSSLSDPNAVMPSLEIDNHGDYEVQLVVNDGYDNSEPDTVMLNVQNVLPVADAGLDQSVYIGDLITLDGTASNDAGGDVLTYHWSILSKPAGSASELSGPNTGMPIIVIDSHGNYVVQLIVNDGIENSIPDTVMLDVMNIRPMAEIGLDREVETGSTVMLDGSGSSDTDGDDLQYEWNIISKPADSNAVLTDSYTMAPTFVADYDGMYIVQLIVNDGLLTSEPDTVDITAVTYNYPPECAAAEASPEVLWPSNHKFAAIKVQGVSDPDNDPLTITVTGVTQDEPVNDNGDGDTSPDAVIDSGQVQVRIERTGSGNGRVYEIHFMAEDGREGICTGTVTVGVPHSQNNGEQIIDDGQLYDATLP